MIKNIQETRNRREFAKHNTQGQKTEYFSSNT